MSPVTVLTPTATLGYGFDADAFERGISLRPHAIAVDAGSTDPGPHYLGTGEPLVSRFSMKKELSQIIAAGRQLDIPIIVGSAGGSGSKAHVDWTRDIVREIAHEQQLHFRLASIYADVPKERVKQAIRDGETKKFETPFELNEKIVDETKAIVAQMGHEPISEALEGGAQVVIAGRACDDCAIAAYPIWRGADRGCSIHMGKILECGAFSAEPFGLDVMLGTVSGDHFVLEPGSLNRRASISSVAAHSLYERENPFEQSGPGHRLDFNGCLFEQADDRKVKVSGSQYTASGEYWVKLEGVRTAGFRTICIAGIRCPTMIERIDDILATVRRETLAYFDRNSLSINYHVYGRDGVMRSLEPVRAISSHELCLVIEAVAADQDLARGACHRASGALLHHQYNGQFNTSGNLAFLYSPSEIDTGPSFEFNIYHLMKINSPTEIFPIHFEEL